MYWGKIWELRCRVPYRLVGKYLYCGKYLQWRHCGKSEQYRNRGSKGFQSKLYHQLRSLWSALGLFLRLLWRGWIRWSQEMPSTLLRWIRKTFLFRLRRKHKLLAQMYLDRWDAVWSWSSRSSRRWWVCLICSLHIDMPPSLCFDPCIHRFVLHLQNLQRKKWGR